MPRPFRSPNWVSAIVPADYAGRGAALTGLGLRSHSAPAGRAAGGDTLPENPYEPASAGAGGDERRVTGWVAKLDLGTPESPCPMV